MHKGFIILLFSLLTVQFSSAQQVTVMKDSINIMIQDAGRDVGIVNPNEALMKGQKALDLAYQVNDIELIAKAYNVIGMNYIEIADYSKAEQIYFKAIRLIQPSKLIKLKCWLHNNLAILYGDKKGDFSAALVHYLKSLEYAIETQDEYEILFSNINIATCYFNLSKYEEGLVHLNKADQLIDAINQDSARLTINSLYADYYFAKKNYPQAELFYKKALSYVNVDLFDDFNIHYNMELYDDIAAFYNAIGKDKLGYEYLKKHLYYKDLYNEKLLSHSVAQANSMFDITEYERKLSEIENERNQQNKVIYFTTISTILLSLLIVTLLVFSYYLFKNNKYKLQANKDLEAINEELKLANLKAQESSNAKSNFISNISHELRTPLYAVVGLSKIIEDDNDTLKDNIYMKSLKFSASYLLNLINDVLQIHKIELSEIKIESTPINLRTEINSIVGSLQYLSESNSNEVHVKIADEFPEFIKVDKLKMSQIIFNLASNALKFTKNGQVSLQFDYQEKNSKMFYMIMRIKDNGVGISSKDIDLIFEKFSQVQNISSDYQGTGLGLTIVKELVDLMGGDIKVRSELNVGSEFIVHLPVYFALENETIFLQEHNSEEELIQTKILVIENNSINQLVTARLLSNFGYVNQVVDSGYQALDLLKRETFDMILTDINMPEMDGFQTSNQIRSMGIDIPIIAITAYNKEEIEQEFLQSSIDDVLTKPFNVEDLHAMIAKHKNKQKALN